ncbi:MAG: glycoside hydrolase family 65 protein, partial [Candidatus Omnitrophica bacterium]|nr:glycoside hydrolase family 65 protein [Candidatus Omnitrophota bacterium]
HVGVDNNAFTNMMAKWNLIIAAKSVKKLKKNARPYRELKKKLSLSDKEVSSWKQIASRIAINSNNKKVIEQFDGYFKLKKVDLNRSDENGLLLLPLNIKAKDLGKTRIIKQADVLMLLILLDDVFNSATKAANYDFYISQTVHKSSLSAPMHALAACEVGDLHRAYNLFNVSLRTDISNLYGNTPEGIHAASLGGTWQALIFGFAGVKIKKEELFINPRMPRSWRKMIFCLTWQDNQLRLELNNDSIGLKVFSTKMKNFKLGIFDKPTVVKTNTFHTFRRDNYEKKKEEYY